MIQRGFGVIPTSRRSASSIDLSNLEVFKSPLQRVRSSIDVVDWKTDVAKFGMAMEMSSITTKRQLSGTQSKQHVFILDDPIHSKKSVRRNNSKNDNYVRCSTDEGINSDDVFVTKRRRNVEPRRVGFHMNENGNVLCTEFVSSEISTSNANDAVVCNKKELWWNKKDRMAARKNSRTLVKFIQLQRPEYRQATLHLLSKFGGMGLPMDDQLSDYEAVIISATCGARGLEKRVYSALGIPKPEYWTSVERLLAEQTRLIQEGCFDINKRADMLASQYRKDSNAACAMARLLADGDFLVAQTSEMVQI
jgi:hypothetical protein